MSTEKLTATERLENLETWGRRSAMAMMSCAVLLTLIGIHMMYVQASTINYRGAIDARNAMLDRETAERDKIFAEQEATMESLRKLNAEQTKNFRQEMSTLQTSYTKLEDKFKAYMGLFNEPMNSPKVAEGEDN